MISKTEAMKIILAMVENAIKCNNNAYECKVTHDSNQITFKDMFGESTITYQEDRYVQRPQLKDMTQEYYNK